MQNSSKNKKSFILHKDSLEILSELTDEQAGKLFKAIRNFHNETPIELDVVTKMIFLPFKNQFIRDNEKYVAFVESQSAKGKLSADKRNQPQSTDVNQTQPLLTESTYKDSDSDSDKEKDSESVSDNENNPHSHFLDFNFYKTAYIDLPIELQTNIENQTWQTWQTFNQHIDSKCKRIRQIPEQMNFNDYLEYRDRYIKSGLIDTLKLKTMLSKFNNCQSAQKYISVYDGLIDWSEREITYLKVV